MMSQKLKEDIIELANTIGPSGYEEDVLEVWNQKISSLADTVSVHELNNTVAIKKGTDKKVMIMAHADEIGLIIRHIDENGFLYFEGIGSIDPKILPGKEASIKTQKGIVQGVIGMIPLHLQDNPQKTSPTIEEMWIDIHARSKDEAESLVEIGDVAIVRSEARSSGDWLIGKSMDDRSGLGVLLGVAKELSDEKDLPTICYVASTQEELRGRGAQTISARLAPDIAIVVDVTHATDYPGLSVIKYGDIRLGGGCVIAVGPNMDKDISSKLKAIAKSKEIKHQVEACGRPTGTDANTVQTAGFGNKTALVSIPCRYMHTSVETVALEDIQSAARLIAEYIRTIK